MVAMSDRFFKAVVKGGQGATYPLQGRMLNRNYNLLMSGMLERKSPMGSGRKRRMEFSGRCEHLCKGPKPRDHLRNHKLFDEPRA